MAQKSTTKLLAAAEQIVINNGIGYLTIRRVGHLAGLNSALITYHFGGVSGLVETLCEHNLAPMREAWRALDADLPNGEEGLNILIQRWLEPLLQAATYTPNARALTVIDEIASREHGELSEKLTQEMAALAHKVHNLAMPFLPHLSPEELMTRLRFIAGAALGPPPRNHATRNGLFASTGEKAIEQLTRFARASLRDIPTIDALE